MTLLSAFLLVFAFPDFEKWWLAWIGFVPFFWAVYASRGNWKWVLFLGWVWGTFFFFGTCWWITHSLIHYGGIPTVVSYLLIFIGAVLVGAFKAFFSLLQGFLFDRYGIKAIIIAPFLWVSIEFLRFKITGNNWNAIAYSQAFIPEVVFLASVGGIYLVGFLIILANVFIFLALITLPERKKMVFFLVSSLLITFVLLILFSNFRRNSQGEYAVTIIVLQPNVPMSGLNYEVWEELRQKHVRMAEEALARLPAGWILPRVIVFPESPMNFSYGRDEELQRFLGEFTKRNRVFLLFNSAEPNFENNNFFNSAVMLNERGEKIGQYNKIFLVPFGEYAPVPDFLRGFVPTLVGNFEAGDDFKLLTIGDTKVGIMICFESHFPNLSREYARQGADFLIEMTNDGYLGRTPVLKQHLANAIFRAVETARPVVRATNVGITALITEDGKVLDEAEVYTEATRIWQVRRSDIGATFYVKYGDWLAFLSLIFSSVFLVYGLSRFKG